MVFSFILPNTSFEFVLAFLLPGSPRVDFSIPVTFESYILPSLTFNMVPDEDSIGYEMDGRYVWIPYQEIVL